MAGRTQPRNERRRTLGAVRRLFESGHGGFVYPFRYVWYAESDSERSVEVLFSTPKKFHKRANKRNLVRRRTKEAYRLQKELLTVEGVNLDMALIYSSKEILSQRSIAKSVRRILEAVAEQVNHSQNND